MKNEKMIFDLFVAKGDRIRPYFNEPFAQEGFVYATDGIMLIRVRNSEIEGEYPLRENPVCSSLFKETENRMGITLSRLKKLLSEIPTAAEFMDEGEDIECEECDGTGEVTWEYRHWESEHACPACDGSGFSRRKKHVPTGNRVPDMKAEIFLSDKKFIAMNIRVLIKAMELTGVDSAVMKHNENRPAGLSFFDLGANVEIILMPL